MMLSRWLPDGHQMASRALRWHQEGSKAAQLVLEMISRRPADGPIYLQEGLRWPQEDPKSSYEYRASTMACFGRLGRPDGPKMAPKQTPTINPPVRAVDAALPAE